MREREGDRERKRERDRERKNCGKETARRETEIRGFQKYTRTKTVQTNTLCHRAARTKHRHATRGTMQHRAARNREQKNNRPWIAGLRERMYWRLYPATPGDASTGHQSGRRTMRHQCVRAWHASTEHAAHCIAALRERMCRLPYRSTPGNGSTFHQSGQRSIRPRSACEKHVIQNTCGPTSCATGPPRTDSDTRREAPCNTGRRERKSQRTSTLHPWAVRALFLNPIPCNTGQRELVQMNKSIETSCEIVEHGSYVWQQWPVPTFALGAAARHGRRGERLR